MEDCLRPKLLVLRPDLYTGHLLTIAVFVSALEISVVAWAPQSGQFALAVGWIALFVAALVRLEKMKVAHELTSEMQLYRFVVGIVTATFLSWIGYIELSSAPKAMRLPLLTEAKFILVVNMLAALDAVIIAALAICIVDRILELKDRLR